MMNNKKRYNSIFSKDNLENINFILEDKIKLLNNEKRYKKISEEITSIYESLESKFSDEDVKKLERLFYLHGESELYTNTLAYFLGVKLGQDIMSL